MTLSARSLFCCFCLLLQAGFAQLTFKSIPSPLQMMPRDKNDLGHFEVSGTCDDPDILSLRAKLRRNTDTAAYSNTIITFDNKAFTVTLSIRAELAEYTLEVYALHANAQETLEKSVGQLVAGDFLIATGQSNATGGMWLDESPKEDATYSNYYCRTIGSMFQWAATFFNVEQDCRFLRPSTYYEATDQTGCVGVWPLRVMYHMVQATGIPVCLINGAMGGTTISYHMATHTPSDPNNLKDGHDGSFPSTYDRMFRKLYANHATEGVKAVFWYQGESDGALSKEEAEGYTGRFRILRNSWKLDYPNLEKIFVFQINTGCGGDNLGLIREQERRFPEVFPDVLVVPTVGSLPEERQPDGCHYMSTGNQKLGENMSKVVQKYLCHQDLDDNYIMGPNIRRVYYSRPGQLALEFDKDVTVQQSRYFTTPNAGTVYLKDYFYKRNKVPIKVNTISSVDNVVYLDLADSLVEVTRLTYLPEIFSNLPTVYTGPWILNKRNENLGAFSFFEFPVEPYDPGFWATRRALLIYPNPTKDFVCIRMTDMTKIKNIYLSDGSGKLLMAVKNPADNLIDLRDLESGLYILSCYTSDGLFREKIILNK